jgi:hypothetical protein
VFELVLELEPSRLTKSLQKEIIQLYLFVSFVNHLYLMLIIVSHACVLSKI